MHMKQVHVNTFYLYVFVCLLRNVTNFPVSVAPARTATMLNLCTAIFVVFLPVKCRRQCHCISQVSVPHLPTELTGFALPSAA